MRIKFLIFAVFNLVNGFWNAGLQRKFFGGGHNHRGKLKIPVIILTAVI